MTSLNEFLADGAKRLVAAERARRARRRRRVQLAAAAVVAVVVASVALGTQFTTTSDASSVQVVPGPEGLVTITVDEKAPPDRLLQDFSDSGVPAEVVSVPTGPSRRGQFLGLSATNGRIVSRTEIVVLKGTTVKVQVGVAAHAGQGYSAVTDAFARSEPLACLGGQGAPAASVAAAAPSSVTIDWRSISDNRSVAVADLAGWVVSSASALSANHVLVLLVHGDPVTRADWCSDR